MAGPVRSGPFNFSIVKIDLKMRYGVEMMTLGFLKAERERERLCYLFGTRRTEKEVCPRSCSFYICIYKPWIDTLFFSSSHIHLDSLLELQ